MKKFYSLITVLLLAIDLLAQAPQKMSYQAVIRNASNNLVVNQSVGIRISIIQGTIFGASLYVETHTASTNANGLVSIEIGSGNILNGNFNTIDWANGPYFIKTETDPTGGSNYTIVGTNQLLSVPYALHAKTAESISGGLSETDPLFNSSVAKNINSNDTARWNNKLNSYTETDPTFNNSIARNITANDTTRWNNKLSSYTELDPTFNNSIAKNISSSDTSSWNNKQPKLIAGNNITISGNTISATNTGFIHYIGEYFGGGVIFHLWKDSTGAEHGLIVEKTNLSTSQVWSNISSLIGISAQSSWDGLNNSIAIVNQPGHTSSAAKLCLDLVSGGQNDWYLPSIDELSLMWHNRFAINKTLSTINGASPIPQQFNGYWSSTEHQSGIMSWDFISDEGRIMAHGKSNQLPVRAIRSF